MATLLRPGPGGDVYVLDSGRSRVLRLSPEGRILTPFGDPSLGSPTDIAVGANGEVWVCDLDHGAIAVFSPSGSLARRIELDAPVGRLALSPGGGFVATGIEGGQGLFRRYFLNGEPVGAFAALFPEDLQTSIAADGWIVPHAGGDLLRLPQRRASRLLHGRPAPLLPAVDRSRSPAEGGIDAAGRQSVPDATVVRAQQQRRRG